ncbi:phospholipase A [Shewanella psychrophila]|nr:phospholipase A [Shewanella psychrophila]
MQYFNGYEKSLIDYNARTQYIGNDVFLFK